MSAETIKKGLAQASDAERAAFFPRFFKTRPGEYAEGDQFIGVTVPEQQAVEWMLREVGERDLPRLEAFLELHAGEMPRTRYFMER